jgi:DNA-binding HxlR family transcriptional regulator
MRSYGQYCPVAVGSELLAERWTLLIVRELLVGATRFGDLIQGLPGINRTLLSARLRRLEDAGLVARSIDDAGPKYELTPAGRALEPIVWAIGDWAVEWLFGEPKKHQLDPLLLLWWMRGNVRLAVLPPRRTTIEFEFTGRPHKRCWLVIHKREVTSCWKHPGFEVDVRVTVTLADMYRVWLGRMDFGEAIAAGVLRLEGPRGLVRLFPRMFDRSRFADAVHARAAACLDASERRQRTG